MRQSRLPPREQKNQQTTNTSTHENSPFESIPKERASIKSSLIDIKWPYFRSLTTSNEQVSSLPRLNVGTNSNNRAYPSNKETKPYLRKETDSPTTATTSIEEDLLTRTATYITSCLLPLSHDRK